MEYRYITGFKHWANPLERDIHQWMRSNHIHIPSSAGMLNILAGDREYFYFGHGLEAVAFGVHDYQDDSYLRELMAIGKLDWLIQYQANRYKLGRYHHYAHAIGQNACWLNYAQHQISLETRNDFGHWSAFERYWDVLKNGKRRDQVAVQRSHLLAKMEASSLRIMRRSHPVWTWDNTHSVCCAKVKLAQAIAQSKVIARIIILEWSEYMQIETNLPKEQQW